jgi:osmotically inducible protein OsmC
MEVAMKITKKADVVWNGGIKDGKGAITTESGALKAYPYGFTSRFEGKPGTNPEELLAAAHAGCFTMALSLILTDAQLRPDELATTAEVTLEKVDAGFEITAVNLTLRGRVPGATAARFQELAETAKVNCPLSKVIKAPISLNATLMA